MKHKGYYMLGAGLAGLAFIILKKSNVLSLCLNPASTLDTHLGMAIEEGLDKDTFSVVSEFRERVSSGKIGPMEARGYLNGMIPIGTLQPGALECQPYRCLRIKGDGFVYLK